MEEPQAEGASTFSLTLAQEAKPSLQLLWTEAPQSARRTGPVRSGGAMTEDVGVSWLSGKAEV